MEYVSPEENKDLIIECINSGYSLKEICSRFGCGRSGLVHFVRRHNLNVINKRRKSVSEYESSCIVDDYLLGMGTKDICTKYSICRTWVYKVLHSKNIEIRDPNFNNKLKDNEINEIPVDTNKYYVYQHLDNNGKLFYIGKGIGKRLYSKIGRNKEWHQITKSGYTAIIVKENLTVEEAIELEGKLILENFDLICNKKKYNGENPLLSTDDMSMFRYNEESPSCLERISLNRNAGSSKLGYCTSLSKSIGKEYYVVCLNYKCYKAHRIIWQLFNGQIPFDMVIDHIDGNKLNNKISNLRMITRAENSRNLSRGNRSDTSLIVGVSYSSLKGGFYSANWVSLTGRRHRKSFSVNKYGEELAKQLATEYRLSMLEELNNQGAGYTERHIKG